MLIATTHHHHQKASERPKRVSGGVSWTWLPTHSSWVNLVESFFSIITRQAIRRASFTSVRQVTDAIRTFIDAWNDRCVPFMWTKTVEDILTVANRKAVAETDHELNRA